MKSIHFLLHHLQTSLHDIHGKRHNRAEQTGSQRGNDVQTKSVRLEQMPLVVVQLLGLGITSELSGIQHHSTDNSSRSSLPESFHSLLLANAVDGLETVGVSTALLGRQTIIGGGANESNLGGVSNHSSTSSSHHTTEHLAEESNLAVVVVFPHIHAGVVHSHAGSGVGDLAKDSGGVTSSKANPLSLPLVQLEKSLALGDLHNSIDTAGVELLARSLSTTR